jgi:hypothetical protein
MNPMVTGFFSALAGGLALAAIGQGATGVSAIDVSTPNRILAIKASEACSVDFRNIRVYGENRDYTARLRNGKYKRKFDSGYEAVNLNNVFCFEPKTGHARQAIIVLEWLDCGGSCSSTGIVQLVAIRSGHPVVIQQFVYDSHATGTGVRFDPNSLLLTIIGRSNDGSPNCCAKNLDLVTYRWQGPKFVQEQYKRVPAPPPQRL